MYLPPSRQLPLVVVILAEGHTTARREVLRLAYLSVSLPAVASQEVWRNVAAEVAHR